MTLSALRVMRMRLRTRDSNGFPTKARHQKSHVSHVQHLHAHVAFPSVLPETFLVLACLHLETRPLFRNLRGWMCSNESPSFLCGWSGCGEAFATPVVFARLSRHPPVCMRVCLPPFHAGQTTARKPISSTAPAFITPCV